MKLLISFVTLLGAAGFPLTAAALDYGPGQRVLAAETEAPALPGTRGENPFADPASHRSHSDDDDAQVSSNDEPAPRATAPRTPATHRKAAPNTASAPGSGNAAPKQSQSVLSWQSLLPGSIQ